MASAGSGAFSALKAGDRGRVPQPRKGERLPHWGNRSKVPSEVSRAPPCPLRVALCVDAHATALSICPPAHRGGRSVEAGGRCWRFLHLSAVSDTRAALKHPTQLRVRRETRDLDRLDCPSVAVSALQGGSVLVSTPRMERARQLLDHVRGTTALAKHEIKHADDGTSTHNASLTLFSGHHHGLPDADVQGSQGRPEGHAAGRVCVPPPAIALTRQ